MMREINLLNRGNANLFVRKSEVLSAEGTLINFDFFLSLFRFNFLFDQHSSKVEMSHSTCKVWYLRCIHTSLVILFDDCSVLEKSHEVRHTSHRNSSSFRHSFTALISDSAVDVDKLP